MLRGNESRKGYRVPWKRAEGREGAVEILITPFEAEMLRVVLEAMRDCCADEASVYSPHLPERRGSVLRGRVAKRRDS